MRQWKLYLLLAFIFTFSLSFIHAQQVDNQVDSLSQIDTIASVRRYIPEFTPQQVNTRSSFLISSITVVGNKKTRSNIILREVPFTAGMSFSLSLLIDLFKQGEQQIMNTALFHSVRIYASKFEGNCLEITVEVVERWYLFPFPFFDLVDRNINQWLIDQKASLQRVNYGLKLLYNNTTGHNDKLRLWLINGYTRELSISYEKPYFDRKMQWGFRLAARTGKGREINYNTIEDKQVFLRTPDFIRSFASVGGELTYRKKLFARHNFGIFYFREKVEDTVLRANPDYFRVRGSINQFPELYYQFTYAKMDYIPYPREGFGTRVRFSKLGITPSFNLWQLHWQMMKIWPVGLKNIVTLESYAGVKLPFSQPYVNRRFLGYEEIFMRGFEYNVVDGVAGGYLRSSFARELFRVNIPLPGFIRKRASLSTVPFKVFGKLYSNAGYVYSPEPGFNFLQNKFLHAAGFGIDILSLYDLTIRIEYSFNNFGQNGLFLHRTSSF
jgi:outer membrane protein assembly factor BamA